MAQLTRSTGYAIRGMRRLATSGKPLHIEQIAHAERLSPTFMAKVFQSLARAGLIRTKRGRGGGVELARPASGITLLEVIEAMEGPIINRFCLLDHTAGCGEGRNCEVHEVWLAVQRCTAEILRQTTLARLLGDGRPHASSNAEEERCRVV